MDDERGAGAALRVLAQIERFVRETMAGAENVDLRIAHDDNHVDRVRRWALRIAAAEAFPDAHLVEAAALLHDIGLAHLGTGVSRRLHGPAGAPIAAAFLREVGCYTPGEVAAIAEAIRCHSGMACGGTLGAILRDADALDALGAVGIGRAFASKYVLPEYDPAHPLGETWGLSGRDFDRRFAAGQGIGPCIVDQINFQISFAGNLNTAAARRMARPLVAYMRAYLQELAREVTSGTAEGDGTAA